MKGYFARSIFLSVYKNVVVLRFVELCNLILSVCPVLVVVGAPVPPPSLLLRAHQSPCAAATKHSPIIGQSVR